MANIAVVADDFATTAHVLAVVTTKTTIEIKMADVVRVSLPVSLHFREEIGLEDSLDFSHRPFNDIRVLSVNIRILLRIELIET